MALGIVKYFYNRPSQPLGSAGLRSVVVDAKRLALAEVLHSLSTTYVIAFHETQIRAILLYACCATVYFALCDRSLQMRLTLFILLFPKSILKSNYALMTRIYD